MTTLFLSPDLGQPREPMSAEEVSRRIGLAREPETIRGVRFERVGLGADSVRCGNCGSIMDISEAVGHAREHNEERGEA
jgi:hypothetical protein